MSSLRALRTAASALKACRTVAPTSARTFAQRSAITAGPSVSRTWAAPVAARCFSLSARAFGQGESDVELAAKLKEEIQYEKEAAEQAGSGAPEFVKEFTADGVWKIEHQDGHDEVALVRQFGNENIRVVFSIGDLDTPQEVNEYDEEGNPIANDEDATSNPVFAIRCSITITKPDGGALSIDAVAEDGSFAVDNVSYYADAKLAGELSAEADWKRRGLYIGPQFDHLDVGVQESFEKYLDERDIGPALAGFIPEFAEWKEQKEYTKWLEQVHKFVSA
ncbi:Mitochondrial acidic protein mam33 [Tulasnella sp. UAMH 9824]|nr:Mitochondrial acidic protein mam33 [Tulasnella sp. UAMH 9824]